MNFFHGTDIISWNNNIQDIGLTPRNNNLGSFYTNADSNSAFVYLSDLKIKSEFSGFRKCLINLSKEYIILHIDEIEEYKLYPDENYLRGENCPLEQAQFYTDDIVNHKEKYKDSLRETNLVAHLGNISKNNIKNVEYIPIEKNPFYEKSIFEISDLQTRLLNHDWYLQIYNMTSLTMPTHYQAILNAIILNNENILFQKSMLMGYHKAIDNLNENTSLRFS